MTHNTLLPDAAARQIILENLDENLVVEAAAGTGKTTSLVGRVMNLFRSGKVNKTARLAAVTFTVKAATELRQRLEEELDRALDNPIAPPASRERRNLALAKTLLPECHIGTIHSFCARLLRERPVEAGVPPDFRELEQDEDMLYRKRAWDEFSRRLTGGKHPDLYRAFELFGLDLDTLGQGFARFADFPDIHEWPGLNAGLDGIDINAFSRGIDAFSAGLDRLEPRLSEAECGKDTLIPLLQNLARRRRRQAPNDIGAAFQLCRALKANPNQVQRQWKDCIGLDKEAAIDEKNAYARLYEDVVLPFRNQCLAAVYAGSLAAFDNAKDIYDRLRREDGVLNFQDLLMLTAAALRDFPEVREDLSGRYARLLVDEVQDTDPVQAEIMFLLAADDSRERDWRRCVPRPGALFIVGDPKQSIYRFRRADIVVYQDVKRRIVETGGRQLGLTANFRSQPAILDWVNATLFLDDSSGDPAPSAQAVALSGKFGPDDSPYSPAYAPLRAGLSGTREGWSGVFSLETLSIDKKAGVDERAAARDEAARIAAFIRNAIDTGLLLPGRAGPRPARPDDFLIVTYRKSKASPYAEALRSLGIECLVSSGSALSDSPALALLPPYLDALLNPDDGIRLLAVLRGGLFGVADTELYRWKKAG
ncbi:MAG: UvrD-helicase domain-containing protein, partial [Planctomycetota bacterium]|nr:UvrD-helicase domain-containing protein [Planctomycetota bacterium]